MIKPRLLLFLILAFCAAPTRAQVVLPYHATEARKQQIITGASKIHTGMQAVDLQKHLGKEDEIKPLYEPRIYKPAQIGYSYWYYIQKLKEDGSAIDRGVVALVIYTNLGRKITKIEKFDF